MKIWSPISTLVITVALLVACDAKATPTAQELKQAGQELFDTFSASIQSADAAALHGIFVADLRERCTAEQIQESLLSSEIPPSPNPESTEGRPWGQPLKKPAGAPLNLG